MLLNSKNNYCLFLLCFVDGLTQICFVDAEDERIVFACFLCAFRHGASSVLKSFVKFIVDFFLQSVYTRIRKVGDPYAEH